MRYVPGPALKQPLRSLFAAFILIAVSGPSLAFAQAPERAHKGFWFAGGLGWGTADCELCGDERVGGAVGVLAVGGTLSQRLMLGASANTWIRQDGDITQTLGALSAVVRFYPFSRPQFSLLGGLGVSAQSSRQRLPGTLPTQLRMELPRSWVSPTTSGSPPTSV